MTKKLKPVHPGEILREEFMVPLGLSMNRVAMDLRVPVTRDRRYRQRENAQLLLTRPLRFARYFNISPTFWMNLQTRYDLEVAEDEIADKPQLRSSTRCCPPLWKQYQQGSFKTKDGPSKSKRQRPAAGVFV